MQNAEPDGRWNGRPEPAVFVHDLARCIEQGEIEDAGQRNVEARFGGGEADENRPKWQADLPGGAHCPEDARADTQRRQRLCLALGDVPNARGARLGRRFDDIFWRSQEHDGRNRADDPCEPVNAVHVEEVDDSRTDKWAYECTGSKGATKHR